MPPDPPRGCGCCTQSHCPPPPPNFLSFLFGTFFMLFLATRNLVEDEWYIVIKVYNFTIFEILRNYLILHVCIIPTYRVYDTPNTIHQCWALTSITTDILFTFTCCTKCICAYITDLANIAGITERRSQPQSHCSAQNFNLL